MVTLHHQEIQEHQNKAWHDRNLKRKKILVELFLMYNSKIKGKPRNLETTWLGPYIIKEMNSNGTSRLKTL